ncbi:MAG: hypothetical protein AAGF77_00820 [Bacteroidota bacterium]
MKWIIFPLFLISMTLFAQNSRQVADHQWSLNVLLPGVGYEYGVGDNATIAADLAFGFSYRDSDFFGDDFGLYPVGTLQYRHYYNFERRLRKNKHIDRNTGNYVAPTIILQSGQPIIGDLESNTVGAVAALYGLQRTGRKGFQWNFRVGPAYFFGDTNLDAGIVVDFKLGFVLGKK